MGLTKNEAMDLRKVTISVIPAKAGICFGLGIINEKVSARVEGFPHTRE